MSRQPRHRRLCFTVNATEGIPLRLLDLDHSTWEAVSFCVYQREMGNHEHFQGYMEFKTQATFAQVHAMEGMSSAALFQCKGSPKQNIHYCTKPVSGCDCNVCIEELRKPTYLEGAWTLGTPKAQGQRADLLEVQKDLKRGKRMRDIAEDNFPEFVRFGKAFKEYARLIAPKRDFKSLVILIVGPPKIGKSRFATLLCQMLGSHYKVPDKHTGFWCDDYEGEDVFFMDEFDGDRMRPKAFNDLCDRYECVIPSHGSAGHQLISKYIIICSNYLPKFWWRKRSALQLEQTTRRIDVIIPMFRPRKMPNLCHYCANKLLCAFHHP